MAGHHCRCSSGGIAPATPAGLNRAIAFTSEKIARRITLADEPAAPDTPALRAAALRDFGDRSDAEIPDNRCVDCLGVAIELALWGSRSFVRDADGPAVRRCVAKVVASVQPSIGFVGMNASFSNLARLDLALQVDDIEQMWEAIDEWQKQSGAYAYLALLQVLFVLTSTDELPEHMHVLRAPDALVREGDALLRLPPPSFCAPLKPYVFDRDAIGEKTIDVVLYLVTAQILYSPHSFELGIVTRASARAAYNDAVSESTNLILHVRESTEHLRIGLPLRDFLRVVLDRHSFSLSARNVLALLVQHPGNLRRVRPERSDVPRTPRPPPDGDRGEVDGAAASPCARRSVQRLCARRAHLRVAHPVQ